MAEPIATRADVEQAYRLFLNRVPTEQDWQVWGPPIDRGEITSQQLTDAFLLSDETDRRREEASLRTPQLVVLPEFSIFAQKADAAIGAVIAREHRYEPHVAAAIRRLLEPGNTFVDVGANIGYFTLLAASLVGPRGRVVAVEPREANCAMIERSVAANGFENVALHRAAAGAEPASAVLHVLPGQTNGIIPAGPDPIVPSDAERETVETVRVDDLLAGFQEVSVVKMDIEGYEPQAWRGMEATLARHRPAVLFELSPIALRVASRETPESFLTMVAQAGYEPRILKRADTAAAEARGAAEIEEMLRVLGEQGMTHLDILAAPV